MPGSSEVVALAKRIAALERRLSSLAKRIRRLEKATGQEAIGPSNKPRAKADR
ncbi:MAG: hypothetical protein H5T59_01135 [Anaerolineae bacterium]|nr:hypothetical protein [Anaerolineae bacterium]